MDNIILHPATKLQLEGFLANPTHAVLLVGANGIGKMTIAEVIVAKLLQTENLANYPHFMKVSPDGKSISIEAIRQLQGFLQLKTIGTNPYRRAIIIEHSEALTTEAQNAYLKLLEEPPADTVMVLTADNPRSLLPTIMSRLQTLTIHAPGQESLQDMLNNSGKDATTQKQAYFLSGGLPGLLSALLSSDETHPMLANITAAKEILQKQTFERLAMADSLSKQKETAAGVLEALERIATAGINGAAVKQNNAQIKQWHRIRKASLTARQALGKSANTKLTLTNLFLNI
jgi:DNA polymerase-3 subunit delta'